MRAYNTPTEADADNLVCLSFIVGSGYISTIMAQIEYLANPKNWQDCGEVLPIEAAAAISAMMDGSVGSGCSMIGDQKVTARETIEDGWLLCDGTEYDDDDYPLLGAVIHSNLRTSPTTFRVPNMILKFPMGAVAPGAQGGEANVTLTEAQMPSHSHLYSTYDVLLAVVPGDAPVNIPDIIPDTTSSTGGGEAHNNNPEYEQVVWVIRAAYA